MYLPGKWNYRAEAPVNKKLELKNVIIDWLEKNKLGWEASHAQQQGLGFLTCLANTLWMIDGNHKTLADPSCYVPDMFENLQGFNKPEFKKYKIKSKIPPPSPIFHMGVDDKQLIYFRRPKRERTHDFIARVCVSLDPLVREKSFNW